MAKAEESFTILELDVSSLAPPPEINAVNEPETFPHTTFEPPKLSRSKIILKGLQGGVNGTLRNTLRVMQAAGESVTDWRLYLNLGVSTGYGAISGNQNVWALLSAISYGMIFKEHFDELRG